MKNQEIGHTFIEKPKPFPFPLENNDVSIFEPKKFVKIPRKSLDPSINLSPRIFIFFFYNIKNRNF